MVAVKYGGRFLKRFGLYSDQYLGTWRYRTLMKEGLLKLDFEIAYLFCKIIRRKT